MRLIKGEDRSEPVPLEGGKTAPISVGICFNKSTAFIQVDQAETVTGLEIQ